MEENDDKFEITELFMAQADRDRRFYGTIKRGYDVNDVPVVFGKIMVNNGFVCAQAANQDELGLRLDELVIMVLDKGLHNNVVKTIVIADNLLYLN